MTYALSDLARRLEVEDQVVRLFVATDERDWSSVRDCFTDPFTLDMTSMLGGTPATMTPAAIAAAWETGLAPIDHVHHQIGNFRTRVDGERARVHCYGLAWHHRSAIASAQKSRVFVGSYDFELQRADARWRIALMRFRLKFIEGNAALEQAG